MSEEGRAGGPQSRQFPRLRLRLPAALALAAHRWAGHTENLSLRGCRVNLSEGEGAPEAESVAALTLTFPSGTTATIPVRVVTSARSEGRVAAALEFRRPDPALAAFLRLHLTAHARKESGEHTRLKLPA